MPEKSTDYRKYRLSLLQILGFGAMTVLVGAVTGGLMFGNLWVGAAAGLVLSPYILKRTARWLNRRRAALLEEEFCNFMQLAAASLAGGTALENVFGEVADTVDAGKKSLMLKEFQRMDRAIRMNFDVRDVFADFARRSGCSDIMSLSAALSETASAGGDMVRLLRSCVGAMRLKQDTEREIKRVISLPRLNNRIMTAMPFAFTALLRAMSPGFIECLYSWPGNLAMIATVALTGVAWLLGEKIGEVKNV